MKEKKILVNGNDLFPRRPWWQFKKGEAFDYTNAKLAQPESKLLDDGGWDITYMIKPEGEPVKMHDGFYNAIKLGVWWTFRLDIRRFHFYFRYRSWTTNIFYITWD